MDVLHAIASKRDHRVFDPRPIPDELITRILDAGRMAGSARNGQPWRFFVATEAAARASLASCVYVPPMILAAPLVVVIGVRSGGTALSGMDGGRAAQNMMLAAWDEGVASCPNGIADSAAAQVALPLTDGETPLTVIAFGYPAEPRDPMRRSVDEWSRRAKRQSLDELVVRLG